MKPDTRGAVPRGNELTSITVLSQVRVVVVATLPGNRQLSWEQSLEPTRVAL